MIEKLSAALPPPGQAVLDPFLVVLKQVCRGACPTCDEKCVNAWLRSPNVMQARSDTHGRQKRPAKSRRRCRGQCKESRAKPRGSRLVQVLRRSLLCRCAFENDEVSSAALFLFVLSVSCCSEGGGGDLPACFSRLKIKTNLWTGVVWYTEAARGACRYTPGRRGHHEHYRKERLPL